MDHASLSYPFDFQWLPLSQIEPKLITDQVLVHFLGDFVKDFGERVLSQLRK